MIDKSKQATPGTPSIAAICAFILDDAYASTFQTMGQYRTALVKGIRAMDAAPAVAVNAEAVRDWRKIHEAIDLYLEDYELRGEDENGAEGCYTPTDMDRYMISDAINGLFSDDEFMALFDKPATPPAESAQPAAITAGDAECSFVVWWAHNRSKFTTARQAARAAMLDAILPAAPQAAQAAPVDAEPVPSLWNPLTPYGLLIRALRVLANTTMYDMANELGIPPSALSAMEFGTRPVTEKEAQEIAQFFIRLGIPLDPGLIGEALRISNALTASKQGGNHGE
jgi:hypothetical protein